MANRVDIRMTYNIIIFKEKNIFFMVLISSESTNISAERWLNDA